MAFVGYGSITFNSLAKTTLQLAAKPEMRGRVMALWALAWLGSTPIGRPIVGWIGGEAGPRWALIVGGVATLGCGLFALSWAIGHERAMGGMAGGAERWQGIGHWPRDRPWPGGRLVCRNQPRAGMT